ncbi:hypothetical protein XM38_026850 [Halomicronema hongdechloris C2206]|uniref:DUF948 domain-containing protein n=1 Tax=Halomicronema hongdechloris C2206 TaxID=1641165 RepID=A0A1Z3HN61_9CYAN|nr:DUF948 domain-containing protein [Halomicronema hongdechloris]ASC71731.1 hypothetical protein XM38_026850 [Halomicronema hongdechloris C2206]
MVSPLIWLVLSFCLVAISVTTVLVAILPALRELARAARSAEKLFDTLNRELPPTLEALRLTSLELTELTDDVNESMQRAGDIVKQVDQGITVARQQAHQAQIGSRSLWAGVRAAWKVWRRSGQPARRPRSHRRPPKQRRRPPAPKSPSTPITLPRLPLLPLPPLPPGLPRTSARGCLN